MAVLDIVLDGFSAAVFSGMRSLWTCSHGNGGALQEEETGAVCNTDVGRAGVSVAQHSRLCHTKCFSVGQTL